MRCLEFTRIRRECVGLLLFSWSFTMETFYYFANYLKNWGKKYGKFTSIWSRFDQWNTNLENFYLKKKRQAKFSNTIHAQNVDRNQYVPINITATAGGITKIPTNQSATARLITKQLVTVRNRRVVSTDNITSVFPITVIIISAHNSNAHNEPVQSNSSPCIVVVCPLFGRMRLVSFSVFDSVVIFGGIAVLNSSSAWLIAEAMSMISLILLIMLLYTWSLKYCFLFVRLQFTKECMAFGHSLFCILLHVALDVWQHFPLHFALNVLKIIREKKKNIREQRKRTTIYEFHSDFSHDIFLVK